MYRGGALALPIGMQTQPQRPASFHELLHPDADSVGEDGEWAALSRIAHRLKGSSAAVPVARCCDDPNHFALRGVSRQRSARRHGEAHRARLWAWWLTRQVRNRTALADWCRL